MQSVYKSMQTAMGQYQAAYHEPWRGCKQQEAYCNSADITWGDYLGIMVCNFPDTELTCAACSTCAQWSTPAPVVVVNTNECNCYYNQDSCLNNGGSMCTWTGSQCVLASKWAGTTYTQRVLAKPRCTPLGFMNQTTNCDDQLNW